MRVRGIVPGEVAHLIAVIPMGPDARRVVYTRVSGGVDQRMLMRANESQLVMIEDRPTPFDADPDEFKLGAEALRIRQEAPAFTAIEGPYLPLPHQLEAVYGHLLRKIPLRFLLADDPGAGKTIMAGLYLKELALRSDLRRCLVVAPGALVEQWRQELTEKFGMEFEVLDHEKIQLIRAAGTLFHRETHLIARMDQLARDEEVLTIFGRTDWDVVIVDEAHRMSARFGAGREVKATKRYRLGMALREAAQNFLLMTATPHAGKEDDFQLFMRLVDPDRFEGRYREGEHAVGADGLMLRRTKEELVTLDGRPLFTKRAAYTVNYEMSPEENSLYDAVTNYVREEFDRADGLANQQRTNVSFAMTVLQRRLASSPNAIRESLRRRLERLTVALTQAKPAPARARHRLELDALAQEFPADEREEYEEDFVTNVTAARTPDELRREIGVLRQLVDAADRLARGGVDRKWLELRRLLETNDKVVDASGNIRKIIVFTEHRDTLSYLVERCRELLGARGVVGSIHGGLGREQRLSMQQRFVNDPKFRILIATDAAGEGLNLQVAHLMVNYDLPWNPNRLEQRFGRIHRIGQLEMCHLWNLVARETKEGAVYARLLEKLEEMRSALDGKVFDVLGEVFEETPLHQLLIQAIRRGDDPAVRRHLQTVIDERIAEVTRRMVQQHALSPEVFRPAAHEPYLRDVQRARARRLQPHYIQAFFAAAFERAGGQLVKREPGRWEVSYVPAVLREFAKGRLRAVRFPRVCFDPHLRTVDDLPDADLLAPGQQLFDIVRDYTEKRYSECLSRGTIFVDPQDAGDGLRLLAAIESEIVDAVGTRVAGRFAFVEIDQQLRGGEIGARFLDYDSATDAQRAAITGLLNQPWLAAAASTAATWATTADIPAWYGAVFERRRAQVERDRQLVSDRLKQEIAYWEREASLAERSESAQRGQSTRPYAEIDRLQATLDRRMAEFDAQESIQPNPPRVYALAVVVPQGRLDRVAGRPPIDTTDVERRAMDAVLAAERRLGRRPEAMTPNNPGYDICSEGPTNQFIFIEVKGRVAGARTFRATNQEVIHAQNSGGNYRLALVEVSPDGPAHDVVRYVAHPFDDITVTTLITSVEVHWGTLWARGGDPF